MTLSSKYTIEFGCSTLKATLWKFSDLHHDVTSVLLFVRNILWKILKHYDYDQRTKHFTSYQSMFNFRKIVKISQFHFRDFHNRMANIEYDNVSFLFLVHGCNIVSCNLVFRYFAVRWLIGNFHDFEPKCGI